MRQLGQHTSIHRAQQLEQRAAVMRVEPTASERLLWEAVRGNRLGVAFRRQVVLLGKYIADLYAPQLRLVVEIDGGYHGARGEADAQRDRALGRAGCHVLRIDGALVVNDLAAAIESLRCEVARLRAP